MNHGFGMADGGSCVLCRLLRLGAIFELHSGGGIIVDWTTWVALVVACLLGGFLMVALLAPEKFS